MIRFLRASAILLVAVSTFTWGAKAAESAADKYQPAFSIEGLSASGGLMDAYARAANSPTSAAAISGWQGFLQAFDIGDGAEDLTALTLIRQARYELMRLYYLVRRRAEGDALLKTIDEMTVYSTPNPTAAEQWCNQRGYCRR